MPYFTRRGYALCVHARTRNSRRYIHKYRLHLTIRLFGIICETRQYFFSRKIYTTTENAIELGFGVPWLPRLIFLYHKLEKIHWYTILLSSLWLGRTESLIFRYKTLYYDRMPWRKTSSNVDLGYPYFLVWFFCTVNRRKNADVPCFVMLSSRACFLFFLLLETIGEPRRHQES